MSSVDNPPMVASAFAEKVKDKIQAAVIELIPDEQWTAMIENEIERFTKPYREYGKDHPAPLEKMIRDEIHKQLQARLKEALENELRPVWDSTDSVFEHKLPAMVKEAVKENSGELMQALMNETMCRALQAMQQQMQQQLGM